IAECEKYFHEGPSEKGIHYFKVRYSPGEVIMPRGVQSDYAALRLQGTVLRTDGLGLKSAPTQVRDCWQRPGPLRRWVQNWVLDRTDRLAAAPAGSPSHHQLGLWIARFLRC